MSGMASVAGPAGESRVASRTRLAEGARRAWRLPLRAHMALLIVAVAAIAPFVHLDETYTSDEGAYAIQARDVADGHWEFRYAAERYDPDGRWLPLPSANRGSKGWFALVQHPAYSLLMVSGTKVAGGVVGLHLAALAGAVGVAAAAWLLAAEFEKDPWARRTAFWLAASGPVLVHAYILWAHALIAAVAGFTLLAAVRVERSGPRMRVWPLVGLAAGAAGGVFLRSEGVLFGAALAGGLSLVGLRGRPWLQRAAIPALCLGSALAAALAEHRWLGWILGEVPGFRGARYTITRAGAPDKSVLYLLGERFKGAFHTLLRGAHSEPVLVAMVLAALTMVAYAAWAYVRRRPGWERDVAIGLVAACAIYALRAYAGRTQAMTGLLAAWPLVLIGSAALGRPLSQWTRLLSTVSGLFLLAILATQYPIGGGLEWGGRFLAPIYVPLAVLSCVGLRRLLTALAPAPDVGRRVVVGALVLLAVLPTFIGLVMLNASRSYSGRLIDEVTAVAPAAGGRLVMTDVVALPRAAWRTYPNVGWMLVPPDDISEAVATLAAGGVREVTVLVGIEVDATTFASFPKVKEVTGPVARVGGRRTFQLSAP